MSHPRKFTEKGVRSRLLYFAQGGDPRSWVNQVCGAVVQSDEESESYSAGGMAGPLSLRKGEDAAQTFQDYTAVITNQEFYRDVQIPRKYIDRDKTRNVQAFVDSLGMRMRQDWERKVNLLVLKGHNTDGYDGVSFFNTAHPAKIDGVADQSNDTTFDVTDPTDVTPADWSNALYDTANKLQSRLDDQGEPMMEGHSEYVALVPHTMGANAKQAVQNDVQQTGSGSRDNPLRNSDFDITVVSSVRLGNGMTDYDNSAVAGWTDKFVMFAVGTPVTALLRQEEWMRRNVLWAGTEYYRLNKQAWVEVETSRQAGYWGWQMAERVTFN